MDALHRAHDPGNTARMPVAIRPCRPGDAPALTRLAHAAKRHWGYPDALIALWAPALTFTRAFLASASAYAAVEDGRLVGVCAIAGRGRRRELEHMWVLPERIGRGIGRRLLGHAIRRELARGTRRLRIAADPNAEGFYRRLGARLVGAVPSMPAGRTLPLLELELTARRAGSGDTPGTRDRRGSHSRPAQPRARRSR